MRCPPSCVVTGAGRVRAQLAMLPHNITQQAGRLGRFETAVELNRCPDAAMTQKATDCLVIAWMMLQVDGDCRMTVLMQGDAKPGHLLNAIGNLKPEQMRIL